MPEASCSPKVTFAVPPQMDPEWPPNRELRPGEVCQALSECITLF